jgi:hypothetical protein
MGTREKQQQSTQAFQHGFPIITVLQTLIQYWRASEGWNALCVVSN